MTTDRPITEKVQKRLVPYRYDSGNCRVYVLDQERRSYVLIDQGERFAAATGETRLQLHTHTKDGEPDIPLLATSWILAGSVAGTVFEVGAYYLPKAGLFKHDGYSVEDQTQRMIKASEVLYQWACEKMDTKAAKQACLDLGFSIDFRQPDRGAFMVATDLICGLEVVRLEV